ncbi:hypothetical protein V8G54_008386 [Vigna mungo]|uniref:Cupin type-1 domain-containing protein n=1 Tax=Vigna mungo TaxID=3915 RepID=A0AAQ3S9Y2_VIGMU
MEMHGRGHERLECCSWQILRVVSLCRGIRRANCSLGVLCFCTSWASEFDSLSEFVGSWIVAPRWIVRAHWFCSCWVSKNYSLGEDDEQYYDSLTLFSYFIDFPCFFYYSAKYLQGPSGYHCLPSDTVTAADFKYSFNGKPGIRLPSKTLVFPATVHQFPMLNGLGLSAARAEFEEGGFVPLHEEDANEIVMVMLDS